MNDNDIIKALEHCRIGKRENDCKKCPLYGRVPACVGYLTQDALALINRQKAEIERLQKYNTDMARKHYNDGIKEFAEKLKADMFYKCGDINYTETSEARKLIDNLVKEMTGEQE